MNPSDKADHDWLYPEPVDVVADTERPKADPSVWRCDDVGAEPTRFASLIEATTERPRSPAAQVYGSGALLAASHGEKAAWAYTEDGVRRLAVEADAILAGDHAVVLSTLLADDFRAVG